MFIRNAFGFAENYFQCGQANGFLGAPGPAGGIPTGYTLVASEFLKQVETSGQKDRIQMAEFQKQGWTYHAKGLWYTLSGQHLPILTFIGSPNFGKCIICIDVIPFIS